MIRMTRWSVSVQPSLTPLYGTLLRQRYLTVLSRPTLRLYFRQRVVSRHICGSRTRYAVSVCCGGTRKRRRKPSSTRFASSMVAASASRSSVTSLSWKVPAIRSTRPLACGDRANISCTPSSSIARLNWVGAPAASDGGVYLNTACRSAYSAIGMPQFRIRSRSSRK